MSDRLEDIFTDFANSQEDLLNNMNLSKDEFIEKARLWSQTEEGKLEIQKFILQQEISSLEKNIVKLESDIEDKKSSIVKKNESIRDIDIELDKL